ncbi:MAG: hypothetical protein J6330_09560 [Clostridia bacterium]|nr:hypothetical protein [Clostridia bacterium]
MKKTIAAVVAALLLLPVLFGGCKPGDDTDTGTEPSATAEPGTVTEGTDTEPGTDTETEEIIVDEEPVFYEKTERDPVDPDTVTVENTDWSDTIVNANAQADGVQGKFTDAKRKAFLITNRTSSLLYDLSSDGGKLVAGVYNADGKPYFTGGSDVIVKASDGTEFSSAYSMSNGRMNSHRLGYYYYDFRFCDQLFMNPDAMKVSEENENYYDIIAHSGKWDGNDVTKLAKKDGIVSFTVKNANDPYVHCETNFSTQDYDSIQITIKTESSTSGVFYIAAGSYGWFNGDQHISFKFSSGDWNTVVVPISSIPDYTGTVKGFRFDCGETGETIQIKDVRAIKRGDASVPFALERIFHTYSDKMHEVVRVVLTDDYTAGGKLETITKIPVDTVRKFVLKNADGEVSSLDGFDFSTAEYVAFDVKGAGIYGIIMPVRDNNGYISVQEKDGYYVITRGIDLPDSLKKGADVLFGHRIYTTSSHQFNDIRKEAYVERNPLTDVFVVKRVDNARFSGYDPLVGCYKFRVNSSDFNKAYYREPDKHYTVNALFCGDGVADRTVYVQTVEGGGQLECAALLDENNALLPIPLEVGKNFMGEKEEPLYDPKDTSYGEVYVPITIKANENKRFTVLNLYQNWGNYPLKQLSFIAFHICYYHMSVGVTETNCIAPYFVYGKDGWTLPDFRANSAPLWSGQPQHTSAGRLYFLQYKDAEGNSYKSESQTADISSAGPVYADITMDYLSDDGKIKATYRHTETAQTDENRTYYNISLEVLDDVAIADFKNDFSFFTFDGRGITYSKVGYLDEDGSNVTEKAVKGTRIIKLGKEYPYYDYFGGNNTDSVNFALIVMKSDITINGEKYDGNFIFKDTYNGTLNIGSLSLDLDDVTLKKGDRFELEIILMPWGYGTSKDDHNVTDVRNDSCYDPYKLTVIEGEAVADDFIPSVKAVNNTATFKISGGKNTAAVRVYGFTSYSKPTVTFKADGEAKDIRLEGKNGYDGYQVYLDGDGTYSFSFNVDMDKASEYEITVKQ